MSIVKDDEIIKFWRGENHEGKGGFALGPLSRKKTLGVTRFVQRLKHSMLLL